MHSLPRPTPRAQVHSNMISVPLLFPSPIPKPFVTLNVVQSKELQTGFQKSFLQVLHSDPAFHFGMRLKQFNFNICHIFDKDTIFIQSPDYHLNHLQCSTVMNNASRNSLDFFYPYLTWTYIRNFILHIYLRV